METGGSHEVLTIYRIFGLQLEKRNVSFKFSITLSFWGDYNFFVAVAILSIFKYSEGFHITRKGIVISALCLEASYLCATFTVMSYASIKITVVISVVIILSIATSIYLLMGLLYTSIWKRKGK